MNLSFYDFRDNQEAKFKQEIMNRWSDIVDKNQFVEGPYNHQFEKEFAEFCQAKHCALVANGTDALELGLLSLGIRPGDKVGVPSISFFATAEAVENVHGEVVFIDVDHRAGLMCPESLERVCEDHDLKAVIPVHIYGMPAPIDKIESICHRKNIKLLEDSAQGFGGQFSNGTPIGGSNNVSTFSFYVTKNLGAFGDAGAITTNDEEIWQRIVHLRNHGRTKTGHGVIGRNSRCDHLQAAVLQLKLSQSNQSIEMRKKLASDLWNRLANTALGLMPKHCLETSSWHLFPVRLEDKAQKQKFFRVMKDDGIPCALFYEKALPEETPLRDCPGETAKGIDFAASTLCLPFHPHLTEKEIDYIGSRVEAFFR